MITLVHVAPNTCLSPDLEADRGSEAGTAYGESRGEIGKSLRQAFRLEWNDFV